MKRLPGEFGFGTKDRQWFIYTFFSSSKQDKQPKSRKWKDSFPQISGFQPIIMAPEFTEGGIVRQARVTNGCGYFHYLHIGGTVKMLWKSFKLWSSENVTLKTFRLWFAVPPREHAVSTKMISVKSCTSSVFCWPFQCSTTFESSTFQKFTFALVGERTLFLMLCKFSVFESRYLFTIEHCHRASSASRVCGVFNKKRNPQLSLVVLKIWNWFCCLPTATVVCEPLTSTKFHLRFIWDNAFTFSFSTGVVKLLIMNLKPMQTIFTGGNTFRSGIKQFFIGNWELPSFLTMGCVRWQNRRDNAFLRLLYTLLFSIPKTLACLSEAMKLFPYSYFVCLLVVSFNPIKTGHPQSYFENATNILVWSSEHQPKATKLP